MLRYLNTEATSNELNKRTMIISNFLIVLKPSLLLYQFEQYQLHFLDPKFSGVST